DTENDILTGCSVGGDDYISKPFSIKEVIARVKAVGKRLGKAVENPESNETEFADLSISHNRKKLTLAEEKIAVNKTEFEVLALLAEIPDRVFSREKIIETIREEATYITERTVDVHITRLRKKMGDYGQVITNRSGYGYRFDISKI